VHNLNIIRSHFLFSCFLILSACSKPVSVSEAQIATQFRNALNNKDITTLVRLLGTPLTAVEQQWETAKDGVGFVLASRQLKQIESAEKLKEFVIEFSSRAAIEGNDALLIMPSEFTNFKAEFSGAENNWQQLTVYLFKRGEGDVEHIVLLGINPADKKIHAIYIN